MKYIPWILDLICVAVLAVNILSYYRKGFVKVIVSFVGFVAALVCGVLASRFLAELVFHRFIREHLMDALMNYHLESDVTKSLAENLTHSLQSLPDWVSGILSLFSIDLAQAVELIDGLVNPDTAAIAQTLTENLLQPVFLSFLGMVFFLFVFVLLLFVFRRLADLAGGFTNHIPLVGGLNQVLGGALGGVSGLLWVFLLAIFAALFLLITGDTVSWLNHSLIEQSKLFSLAFHRVPF